MREMQKEPSMKMFDIILRRWQANAMASSQSVDSRQQFRARFRAFTWKGINEHFGREPRKARRRLMLALAKKKKWNERVVR
jgi:hypothetical protein